MSKRRITLTNKEMGVIHRLLIFGHRPHLVPQLVIDSSNQQKEDWYTLRDLIQRGAGDGCWCGDSCTCGG